MRMRAFIKKKNEDRNTIYSCNCETSLVKEQAELYKATYEDPKLLKRVINDIKKGIQLLGWLGFVIMLLLSLSEYSYADTKREQFSDVSSKHWAFAFIDTLKTSEIIGGYPDGTFRPQANVKINEFIAMSVKALGYRFESKSSDWAKPYVDKAIELKIIEDREFDSYTANITREQMTSIVVHAIALNEVMPNSALDQYIQIETSDYHLIADYYKQAVLDSYKLGVITGFDDKTFKPKDFSTRAQASAVISKIIQSDLRKPFVKSDIRYVTVPVFALDEFGNDYVYETALYAPLLNGKQVTEMIDVVELMLENHYLGKGYLDIAYSPYEKVVGSSGYETKELKEWFYSLSPYEVTQNIANYPSMVIAVDFNNYVHQFKPYFVTFSKLPSVLEKYSSYSEYYLATYSDQLKPLFRYWFGAEYNTAWELLKKGLDAKGDSVSTIYTINGRTVSMTYGSNVFRMDFSLKK